MLISEHHTARHRFFGWLLEHRWLVMTVAAFGTAVGMAGAARVRIDVDVEQFIPTRGTARATYDEYKSAFSKEDSRYSVFWQSREEPGAELFIELERIAASMEAVGLEDVQWIGGIDVADHIEYDGERTLQMRPLVEPDSVTDEYVARVLDEYRSDALYSGYLWNADQSVFAVHGHLPDSWNHDTKRQEVDDALTASLDSLSGAGARMALSGIPVFRSRSPRLLQQDITVLLGGGLVIAFGLLWLALGRVRLVWLCLASVVPGYLCTLGVMGLVGKPITMLTSFIPIIILVVGVSDSIHIVQRFQRTPQKSSGPDTVIATFADLAGPCLFTSLTTAVGFASLMGTRIGIMVDFGLFTALAILLTYAFSMTLLPTLLAMFGSGALTSSPRVLFGGVVATAVRTAARSTPVLTASFAIVALLCVFAAAGIRSNTFMVDDYKESSPLIRDLRWIEEAGFGLFQLNVFLQQEDDNLLHHPDALRWMEAFQLFVGTDSIVTASVGPPDVFKQLRAAFLDGALEDRRLPETQEEASQLFLLAELEDESFAEDVYRNADGVAQLVFTVHDAGSVHLQPLLERVDRYLQDTPPPVGRATSTGIVSLVNMFTARLLSSFGPSLLIAGVLIFGIMAVMLRSVTRALWALVPNVFPLLVLLGVMRLGGFEMKPSTILVFSIAFGLAVDDTIHVLGRFRTAMDRGLDVAAALEESLRDAGSAVILTSILVVAGFGLLLASQFEVLFLIGMLTAVSAVAAVAADLFLLPIVVRAAYRPSRSGKTAAVSTATIVLFVATAAAPAAARAQDQTAEERGQAIVEESERRDRGWHDQTAQLTMVLVRNDRERIRELRTMTLEGTGDGDKTLVVFEGPADLRGTAFLTHAHQDAPDDQWIYLPALRRVRRIASSNQSSSFMGSEFAYEDIGSQEVEKYRHRYLRAETTDGVEMHVVERIPIDEGSGYTRQVMWLDQGEYRVHRIDYYDSNDELLKTLTVRGYQRYLDRVWRPDEMLMTNHQTGKSTILRWQNIRFGTGLREADFDRRALSRLQ